MKLIKSLGIGLGICFASFNASAQFTSTVVSLTGSVLDQGSKKPTSICEITFTLQNLTALLNKLSHTNRNNA